jgi:hypothetical protein
MDLRRALILVMGFQGEIYISCTKLEIINTQTQSFFTLTDTSQSNIGIFLRNKFTL